VEFSDINVPRTDTVENDVTAFTPRPWYKNPKFLMAAGTATGLSLIAGGVTYYFCTKPIAEPEPSAICEDILSAYNIYFKSVIRFHDFNSTETTNYFCLFGSKTSEPDSLCCEYMEGPLFDPSVSSKLYTILNTLWDCIPFQNTWQVFLGAKT
jgi:hypothetical protein